MKPLPVARFSDGFFGSRKTRIFETVAVRNRIRKFSEVKKSISLGRFLHRHRVLIRNMCIIKGLRFQ